MEMKPEQKTKVVVSTKAKIFAGASVIIIVAWLMAALVLGNKTIEETFYMIYIGWFCWFAAFLCGIISLIATKNIKETPWSRHLALAGCILSIVFTLGMTYGLSDLLEGRRGRCEMNLNVLSTSIKAYCKKHDGQFPDPSKWCDLLLSEPPNESDDSVFWKYFSEKSFRCRTVTEGRSGYAFNKNLASKRISEVDPNAVILFETTAVGWNQNGGPEIMCPDRHKAILGESVSYVVCLGKDKPIIKFVPRSEIKTLRWNP